MKSIANQMRNLAAHVAFAKSAVPKGVNIGLSDAVLAHILYYIDDVVEWSEAVQSLMDSVRRQNPFTDDPKSISLRLDRKNQRCFGSASKFFIIATFRSNDEVNTCQLYLEVKIVHWLYKFYLRESRLRRHS